MARDPVEGLRGLAGPTGPAGHDQRHRQLVEAVQDVEDELERGLITPVQIVDRQHSRLGLGGAGHDAEQAVGDGQVFGVAPRGQLLARARERVHPLGRFGQEGAADFGRQVVEQSADELAGDAEGDVLLELGSGRAEHAQAAPPSLVERCLV